MLKECCGQAGIQEQRPKVRVWKRENERKKKEVGKRGRK
jgi:hypothetical protein